jgi:hypothetical protein
MSKGKHSNPVPGAKGKGVPPAGPQPKVARPPAPPRIAVRTRASAKGR